MDLNIVTAIIRSLAVVAGDVSFGAKGSSISSVLSLIALAVETGSTANEELQKIQVLVGDMVANRREPTKDEWAELKARSDAAHDALQGKTP